MKLPIRSKILLGFALILALSLATQLVGYFITEQFVHFQTEKLLTEKAQGAGNQIEGFMARIEQDMLGISRTYIADGIQNPQKVIDITQYTIVQNPFFRRISILTKSGREVLKIDGTTVTPVSDLSFEIPSDSFDLAVKGKLGISKVFFTDTDTFPYIDVFTPVVSTQGVVVGVIKAQLRLDQLGDVIAKANLGSSGLAYVVDDEGRLIAHPNSSLVKAGPLLEDRSLIATLLKPKDTSLTSIGTYTNEKNIQVVAAGVRLPELSWVVVVEQPLSDAFSELSLLRIVLLTTFFSVLIVLFVSAIIMSESITRPIHTLIAFTKGIKEGDLNSEVKIESGDEIEELAVSLNRMDRQLSSDVTELENEKKLIVGERNKLEVILSGIQDAVIALDLDYSIVMFNHAAEILTGYTASEVLQRPFMQLIRIFDKGEEMDPLAYAPIRTDRFEGITFEKKELTLIGRDNRSAMINLMSATIAESQESKLGAILTFHDVTREHKLEEMKIDFVSMAAHELRTPLTIIRGYVDVLQTEADQILSDAQKEYLNRVIIGVRTLADLIDNLLNVSHIEQGTFKVELSPIAIDSILKDLITSFQSVVHSRGQHLELDMPATLPLIMGDKIRITQVISNLVLNAVNYTGSGGTIRVSAQVMNYPDKTPQAYVQFSVSDTGQGIPTDALPHLFTKFFRVSGKLEQGSKGTGLGLFISKSIVMLHHGDIWVDSTLGKGTTFTFIIPQATENDKAMTTPSTHQISQHGIILMDNATHLEQKL